MLIINADDFGKSEAVNHAIAEAFARGWISSTTALANGAAFEHGVALARRCGFSHRIGIHLCLTEGPALSPAIKAEPRFTDGQGQLAFKRNGSLLMSLREWRAVRAEFEAQLARCLQAWPQMLHADSHHHVHTEVMIGLAAISVARAYGLQAMRLSDNVRPAGLARRGYKAAFNSLIGASGLARSQFFCDLQDLARMEAACADTSQLVELMVHPVWDEHGQLVDADFGDQLGQHPKSARLVSYADLLDAPLRAAKAGIRPEAPASLPEQR